MRLLAPLLSYSGGHLLPQIVEEVLEEDDVVKVLLAFVVGKPAHQESCSVRMKIVAGRVRTPSVESSALPGDRTIRDERRPIDTVVRDEDLKFS